MLVYGNGRRETNTGGIAYAEPFAEKEEELEAELVARLSDFFNLGFVGCHACGEWLLEFVVLEWSNVEGSEYVLVWWSVCRGDVCWLTL